MERSLSSPKADYPGENYALFARLYDKTNKAVCTELGKIISCLIDWDHDANDIPFDFHNNIGDRYLMAGGKMIEYNH